MQHREFKPSPNLFSLFNARSFSIHNAGGAWAIPESLWVRSQEGVLRAANAGFGILETGGSAVDAVVAAVSLIIFFFVLYDCSRDSAPSQPEPPAIAYERLIDYLEHLRMQLQCTLFELIESLPRNS